MNEAARTLSFLDEILTFRTNKDFLGFSKDEEISAEQVVALYICNGNNIEILEEYVRVSFNK